MTAPDAHGVTTNRVEPGRDARAGTGCRTALVLLAGTALAGCAPEAPSRTELARGFTPRPLEEAVARWEAEAGTPTGTTVTSVPHGVELRHELAPLDWHHDGPELFSAALPGGALHACGLR